MIIESNLAGVKVGTAHPVRLMGVINVSPESFYKGSVATSEKALAHLAQRLEREGADFIDVGAMSTAPYLKTEISESEEARRLKRAVRIIRQVCACPISLDTSRSEPAEAGLAEGARLINDVTGLGRDPRLAKVAAQAQGLILMAHPSQAGRLTLNSPLRNTAAILKKCLARAKRSGIPKNRIVIDPGIGFFRTGSIPWWKWDIEILHHLRRLESLEIPILVGVSRKSFIGKLLGGKQAEDRLSGSLAATALAIWNGASLIRTHDIAATRQAAIISKTILNLEPF